MWSVAPRFSCNLFILAFLALCLGAKKLKSLQSQKHFCANLSKSIMLPKINQIYMRINVYPLIDFQWCMGRTCVEVRASAAPVHGGWGEWGAFSACSRACGGGVATSERRCDHPKPAHSGLYCTGLRKRFRVCNTQVIHSHPLKSVLFFRCNVCLLEFFNNF